MTVTPMANGCFDVTSERDETVSYVVDPKTVSCSCPDWRGRRREKELDDPDRRCKHMRKVESQPQPTKLEKAMQTARILTSDDLRLYAEKYQGQAAGAACLLEMAHRAVAALAVQPRPTPAGVECFLVGATEAERERALAIYR